MKNKLIILTVFFSTACGGNFTTSDDLIDINDQIEGSGGEDDEETGSSGGDLSTNTGGTVGPGGDLTGTGGNDSVSTGGTSNTGGAVSTGGAVGTGGVFNTGGTGGVVDPCAITVSEPSGVADCSSGGIDDFEDDTTNLICNPKWGGQFGLVGLITLNPHFPITRDLSTVGFSLQVSAQNSGDVGMGWVSTNTEKTEYVRVDASSYDGISFYAKNLDFTELNTISLGVHTADTLPDWSGGYCSNLSGNCWNGFFAEVELTQDWKKYHVPFCAFQQDDPDIELDPKTILQVQLLARPEVVPVFINFVIDDVSFE